MFWAKFIHVTFAVFLLGSFFASFFYVSAMRNESEIITSSVIKNAVKIDYFLFLPLIIFEMVTGSMMVHYRQYTLTTPWIMTAYAVMTGVFCLVILSARNKENKKIFMILNTLILVSLFLVMHDAVMKHTLVEHFIRF